MDIWKYFDFPIKNYHQNFSKVHYYYDGIKALESKYKTIGAYKHWYSTEHILRVGKYNKLIIKKGFLNVIYNSLKKNIRIINKRICNIYLHPKKKLINRIKSFLKLKYNISTNQPHGSIHLRIGDADNQPFRIFVNKSDIEIIIETIKEKKIKPMIVLSDSLFIKKMLKNVLNDYVITDFRRNCHSKYKGCISKAIEDMLIMKFSTSLILTRGSTFSLFGSYFSKCSNDRITYIGHNYLHDVYYK